MTAQEERRATIARLNDQLRSTGEDGWTYLSRGVSKLPTAIREDVIRAIRLFCDFTPDNDPHGEHDGATLTVGEYRIAWKIDLYDPGLVKIALNGSFSSWAGGPHTQCSRIGFIRSEVS